MGKEFKKDAKTVTEHLQGLSSDELKALEATAQARPEPPPRRPAGTGHDRGRRPASLGASRMGPGTPGRGGR